MITQFTARNFKALRHVTVDLTRVHLLIGQNETGKTSLLEALAALCRSVDEPLADSFRGRWSGTELVSHGATEPVIELSCTIDDGNGEPIRYSLAMRVAPNGRKIVVERESVTIGQDSRDLSSRGVNVSKVAQLVAQGRPPPANLPPAVLSAVRRVHDALTGVAMHHWNPRMLAAPAAPSATRVNRMEASGFGLAQLLDDILGDDRGRFGALERRLGELFPAVKGIKLVTISAYDASVPADADVATLRAATGKELRFVMADSGRAIPASQVSDGLLLVVAYLAVLHSPMRTNVLLLEDPEVGIHPERLHDVVDLVRDAVKTRDRMQVVLTTHSPYVLDRFPASSVSICVRTESGDVAVRALDESPLVRRQRGVFTLGEIWTAEGDTAIAQVSDNVADDEDPE